MAMPKIGHNGSKEVSLILLEETVAARMGLHTFVCNCKAMFLTPYMASHHVRKKHSGKEFKECMSVDMNFLNEVCRIAHWEKVYIDISNNICQNLERVISEKVKDKCAPSSSEVQSPIISQTTQDDTARTINSHKRTMGDRDGISLQKRIKVDVADDASSDSTLKASDSPTTPCDAMSISSEGVCGVLYHEDISRTSLGHAPISLSNIKKEPLDCTDDVGCVNRRPEASRSQQAVKCPKQTPESSSLWNEVCEDPVWRRNSSTGPDVSSSYATSLPRSHAATDTIMEFRRDTEVGVKNVAANASRDPLFEVFNIKRQYVEPQIRSSVDVVPSSDSLQFAVKSSIPLAEKIDASPSFHRNGVHPYAVALPLSAHEDKFESLVIPTLPDRSYNRTDPRFENSLRDYGTSHKFKRELETLSELMDELGKRNAERAKQMEEEAKTKEEDAKKKAVHDKMMQNLYSRVVKKITKGRENVSWSSLAGTSHANGGGAADIQTIESLKKDQSPTEAYDNYYSQEGAKYPPFHLIYEDHLLYEGADKRPTAHLLALCNEYAQTAYYYYGNNWEVAYEVWMNSNYYALQETGNNKVEPDTDAAVSSSHVPDVQSSSDEGDIGSLPAYGPKNYMD